MSFGVRIYNGADEVILDDRYQSLEKVDGGTVYPDVSTGDTVLEHNAIGKSTDTNNTTYPNTAAVWGGTAATLYRYNAVTLYAASQGQLMFLRMEEGSSLVVGDISRTLPYTPNYLMDSGAHTDMASMEFAAVDVRDPSRIPTGFGMALYGEDGSCRWATDDTLAWVVHAERRIVPALQDHVWNFPSWSGWIAFALPVYEPIGFSDGLNPSFQFGRFKRTGANQLSWLYDTRWDDNTWADPTTRTNMRNNLNTNGWSGPGGGLTGFMFGNM